MGALSLRLLLHPYTLIGLASVFALGWAFNQGRHFEQRAEMRRIEATNKRIRAVNAREEATAAKEAELRDKAFGDAAPVLAKADKCIATPDVATALSRIR